MMLAVNELTQETDQELEGEKSHRSKPHPGVKAVKVGDGRRFLVVIQTQVVRVQDGDKADGDARDSQDVEHRVQQLVPDAAATSARPVHQHG